MEHHSEDIITSVVCAAELRFGAERSSRRAAALRKLDLFLAVVHPLPVDVNVLDAYGRVRSDLARRGEPIGPLDTFIAAHALSLDVTLITNNIREFRKVTGLSVHDWTKA